VTMARLCSLQVAAAKKFIPFKQIPLLSYQVELNIPQVTLQ